MNFDRSTFTNRLTSYSPVHASNGTNWNQWSGTTGELNKELDYHIHNPSDSDERFEYRTWSPEKSDFPTNLGGLLSCKIDHINDWKDSFTDDHMVMLLGFMHYKTGPQLVFVQTSVQFGREEEKNIPGTVIKSDDPNFDFPTAVYDSLLSAIKAKYPGSSDNDTARQMMATVAKANVYAFQGSVTF